MVLFLFPGRKATKMIIFLQKLMCGADNTTRPVKVDVRMYHQNNNISIVSQRQTQMTKPNAISPCDNSQESNEGSSQPACDTRTRGSSEVNHVRGQLAAETLSAFLFVVFLALIIVSTIICFIALVVGGGRQEENTRLT